MTSIAESRLFQPLKIGDIELQHRLVLAPLTRYTNSETHTPILPVAKDYYARRSCVPGTLLFSEGSFPSPQTSGLARIPGMWSSEQIAAWSEVTKAVHDKQSFIFCQLWAMGRLADQDIMKAKGLEVLAPSSVPLPATGDFTNPDPPRAMTAKEVQDAIDDIAKAARNAKEAGFDGLELHANNGCLLDQFLQDVTNKREDQWGGSIENRSRFIIETTKAVVQVFGKDRVGVRFSPWSAFAGMKMDDPVPQFNHVIGELREMGIAYIHLVESRVAGYWDSDADDSVDPFVEEWLKGNKTGTVIRSGGFTAESAKDCVEQGVGGKATAIAIGRNFTANPDYVFRIMNNIELNQYDRQKAQTEKAFTDYPFSKEYLATVSS